MPLVPLKRLPSEFDEDAPTPRRRPILVARSRPGAGTEASPAEAEARWENLATDFPDLIKSEVDLVEELEQILRGNIDATDADFLRRPDPCEDESSLEGPTALDTVLADPWDDDSAQAVTVTSQPALGRLGTWDEADGGAAAPAANEHRFWRVGDAGTTARMIRDRRRRSPRSDVLVISGLVLLIAGAGAYAAFRDWTPDDASGTAAPIVQTDAAATPATPGIVAADAIAQPVANNAPPAAETPAMPAPEMTPAPAEATAPAAAAADPFAAEPRTVAVVPVPADNIPPTAPANPAAPAPAAPEARVDTTPQPIDLLNQTPLAEVPAAPPETPAPAEPAAAAPAPEPAPTPAPPPRRAAAPAPPAPAEPAPAANPPVGGTVAVANTWVNMRSGPSSGSPVVRVVDPGTAVTVVSCEYWCEVVVNGATGYIYRDFLENR